METGFLSFFVVKLKQIHIDKGITTGYSTNILQCYIIAIHIFICKSHAKSFNVLNTFTFVFQCQTAIIKYY